MSRTVFGQFVEEKREFEQKVKNLVSTRVLTRYNAKRHWQLPTGSLLVYASSVHVGVGFVIANTPFEKTRSILVLWDAGCKDQMSEYDAMHINPKFVYILHNAGIRRRGRAQDA